MFLCYRWLARILTIWCAFLIFFSSLSLSYVCVGLRRCIHNSCSIINMSICFCLCLVLNFFKIAMSITNITILDNLSKSQSHIQKVFYWKAKNTITIPLMNYDKNPSSLIIKVSPGRNTVTMTPTEKSLWAEYRTNYCKSIHIIIVSRPESNMDYCTLIKSESLQH